jgi:hypothetical protein
MFRYGRKDSATTLKKVRFTTDFAVINQILRAHAPVAQQNLTFSLAGDPLKITATLLNRASRQEIA